MSFSMCPSYKFVVKLIRPIFERPKSVSLMCPMEVMRRLGGEGLCEWEGAEDASEERFCSYLSGFRSLWTIP